MRPMITAATATAASLAFAVVCGAAEPGKLSGAGLKSFVTGKTVVLQTQMGSIPISYNGDGTMTGRSKAVAAASMGPAQDRGTWWIRSDQVCQRWTAWLKGEAHCITFHMEGRIVHWRSNDGHSGTAVIASN